VSDPVFELLRSAGALAVVLALAVVAYLLWRRPKAADETARRLQLIQTLHVGPKERLVWVRQAEVEYLVAFGAAGVQLIDKRVREELTEQPSPKSD
jgi:hypothetical protein